MDRSLSIRFYPPGIINTTLYITGMTGNAIKKALEYHAISPKSIRHYNEHVVGLFFKPDKKLNELIKTCGARCSSSSI